MCPNLPTQGLNASLAKKPVCFRRVGRSAVSADRRTRHRRGLWSFSSTAHRGRRGDGVGLKGRGPRRLSLGVHMPPRDFVKTVRADGVAPP
jgi:hypothetical protein